jgi:hypothetical protein
MPVDGRSGVGGGCMRVGKNGAVRAPDCAGVPSVGRAIEPGSCEGGGGGERTCREEAMVAPRDEAARRVVAQ